jgi:hypothetical protein
MASGRSSETQFEAVFHYWSLDRFVDPRRCLPPGRLWVIRFVLASSVCRVDAIAIARRLIRTVILDPSKIGGTRGQFRERPRPVVRRPRLRRRAAKGVPTAAKSGTAGQNLRPSSSAPASRLE